MCNCDDSNWVKKAKNFIKNQQNLQDPEFCTVKFLLDGKHCGKNNAVAINKILKHLQEKCGKKKETENREIFQNKVLVPLKQKGIVGVLNPGKRGSTFIPCYEDEVKEVVNSVLDRVHSEIKNLSGIVKKTEIGKQINILSEIIESFKKCM